MIFESTEIFSEDKTHPHCHAPVIQELPNGELMALWYAGKSEANVTVGLKASWKPLSGGQWSIPQLVHKTPNLADGNAIIVWYNNELYLFYDVIYSGLFPWCQTRLFLKKSRDYGRTWSESIPILHDQPKGLVVRNKALVIGNRIIIPVGNEHVWHTWSNCIITENGENYQLSQDIRIPKGRNEQPTIVLLQDKSILAYLRTHSYIYQAKSQDLGETWNPPVATSLPCPGSALDMTNTSQGEIILAWNNSPRMGQGFAVNRRALHVGYSPDEGKTWAIIREIVRDDQTGHFAYPTIIQGSDGLFHLIYNDRRRKMIYVKFDLDWLKNAK